MRCLAVTVAVVLAVPGQVAGTVNIWLSETESVFTGSSFPATFGALPIVEPYLGASESIYIWGRPDLGGFLTNLSLNLVAETQPVCSSTCVTPNAIAFTSVTLFNDPFVITPAMRFEFVDDSMSTPPLPIEANRIEGIEGVIIFDDGSPPAIGIGSTSDPRYNSTYNSWLIAEVTYDVLSTAAGSETRLYLEIGPVGMNHADEETIDTIVVFGHEGDEMLNAHDDRGVHASGVYDALVLPRRLPGDASGNGVVDTADYGLWRSNFGSTTLLAADHNENGIVDAADYTIWRDNLGRAVGSGGAMAIPETSVAGSLSIALSALLTVGRRLFGRAKS